MPAFFWGDDDGSIYHKSYFERFDGVWAQHDWMSYNTVTRGSRMHGRSDTTLNPSGIRFGSGEIYNIVEAPPFTTQYGLDMAVCVGRRRVDVPKSGGSSNERYHDNDDTTFLFLTFTPPYSLTKQVEDEIKQVIAEGLSRRHVPHHIVQVDEIPLTINGKKVENAVKDTISGRVLRISETVKNRDCLKDFEKFIEFEGHSAGRAKL